MTKIKSDNISDVLVKHKLRRTPVRADVLTIFFDKPFALSHGDLENALKKKYDRVTIYRTLHSFEEQGIVHKVPDEAGVLKYALCHQDCISGHHQDEHIHFLCSGCGHTFCLEKVSIPEIELPKGYQSTHLSFTVHGICPACSSKS